MEVAMKDARPAAMQIAKPAQTKVADEIKACTTTREVLKLQLQALNNIPSVSLSEQAKKLKFSTVSSVWEDENPDHIDLALVALNGVVQDNTKAKKIIS